MKNTMAAAKKDVHAKDSYTELGFFAIDTVAMDTTTVTQDEILIDNGNKKTSSCINTQYQSKAKEQLQLSSLKNVQAIHAAEIEENRKSYINTRKQSKQEKNEEESIWVNLDVLEEMLEELDSTDNVEDNCKDDPDFDPGSSKKGKRKSLQQMGKGSISKNTQTKHEKKNTEEKVRLSLKNKVKKAGEEEAETIKRNKAKIDSEEKVRIQNEFVKPRKIFIPKSGTKTRCEICSSEFVSVIQLKRHMLHRHGSDFMCNFILSRLLLKKYLREDKSKMIFKEVGLTSCKVCGKSKNLYSKTTKHIAKYHNGNYARILHIFTGLSAKLRMRQKLSFRRTFNFAGIQIYMQDNGDYFCQTCAKHYINLKLVSWHLWMDHKVSKEEIEHKLICAQQRPQRSAQVSTQRRNGVQIQRRYIKDTGLQCVLCQQYFVSKQSLTNHLHKIHSLSLEQAKYLADDVSFDLKCEIELCGYSCSNYDMMQHHMAITHPHVLHRCQFCHSFFKVKAMLERHYLMKHTTKPRERNGKYSCGHCEKTFCKRQHMLFHEFNKHGIKHSNVKVYHCTVEGCGYTTTSHNSLRIHGSKHVKEKRFACSYCDLKLKTEISLKKHVSKMHLGIRPFLCQVCGHSFGEDSEVQTHIKNCHKKDKTFHCEHCSYATNNKGTFFTHVYNVHKMRAEGDNRQEYRCPHCKFVSILYHRYKTHLNGHTNTREYHCKICQKAFISSSTLLAHNQWYHSQKMYGCTQCDYRTKTSQKLNEHIRVQHQLKGLKPYQCPYCNFRCAMGGNCRKHVMQVHKDQEVRYIRDDNVLEAARIARRHGHTMSLMKLVEFDKD